MSMTVMQVESSLCRILDAQAREHFVGTAVLVCDRGSEGGYALTCWHNFDDRFRMEPFDEVRTIENVWLLPRVAPPDNPSRRGPVVVVGQWSNPHQDFAVLHLDRETIDELGLEPLPYSFDVYPGMRLSVVGFQRPDDLRTLDGPQVVVDEGEPLIKTRDDGQLVFEVNSSSPEREIPWDTGISGGAVVDAEEGVLVGLPALVGPREGPRQLSALDRLNPTESHRFRGYVVPLSIVGRTWHELAACRERVRITRGIRMPTYRWRADRSPPGALLRADYRVVPFHGRDREMADLEGWCADERELAVRLYTGQGGMGKTRLAVELCERLRLRGWRAGFLQDGRSGQGPDFWRRLVAQPDAVLLVVDYAESRREELRALLGEAFRSRRERPFRIVLLARHAAPRPGFGDWWDLLKRKAGDVGELLSGPATRHLELTPLADTDDLRRESFELAAKAFGAALWRPAPEAPPSEELRGPHFERVLLLHMTALASVEGVDLRDEQGILTYVLRRERRFWDRLCEEEQVHRELRPGVAQAMMVVSLAGGAKTHAEALAFMARLPAWRDQSRARLDAVSRLLHQAYPGSLWIEPLQPDLLGEHLMQEELEEDESLMDIVFRGDADGLSGGTPSTASKP